MKIASLCIFVLVVLISCQDDAANDSIDRSFRVLSAKVGDKELEVGKTIESVSADAILTLTFSKAVSIQDLDTFIKISRGSTPVDYEVESVSESSFNVIPISDLRYSSLHELSIEDGLSSIQGNRFSGITYFFRTESKRIELVSVEVQGQEFKGESQVIDMPRDINMNLEFSTSVDLESLRSNLSLSGVPLDLHMIDSKSVNVSNINTLPGYEEFVFSVSSNFKGANGESFPGYSLRFFTELDSTSKFTEITDEDLLTKVQEQTFKYFWDFGHPVSGLARERNTSGELVTSGGSGFGVMAILVGIERGFVTRQEGVDRLDKITDFLLNQADRFHGVFPHWLNGTTGTVIPFSAIDNGGDLVETAFLIQGLLAARQYLSPDDPLEGTIIERINTIWTEVEWDWHTRGGENVLYWHWSPNFGWQKNLKISGWNESLIVYILAASSPTFTIEPEVYHQGWARGGAMVNSSLNTYFGRTLPLRSDHGGPLFFAHYSFLGLDPRNLVDQYANYWTQNILHSEINWQYCVANPERYVGYREDCWGLTASDNHLGYAAHSPDNDLGVITPTAAISSIVYAPDQSMKAIRHFYYILGDLLWGEYGFYDAFNFTEEWIASSYLAIDQGPIIVMIENHRSGLLWDLFMSAPEIQNGLQKLNFSYE